jgi:hypothetical protein
VIIATPDLNSTNQFDLDMFELIQTHDPIGLMWALVDEARRMPRALRPLNFY